MLVQLGEHSAPPTTARLYHSTLHVKHFDQLHVHHVKYFDQLHVHHVHHFHHFEGFTSNTLTNYTCTTSAR